MEGAQAKTGKRRREEVTDEEVLRVFEGCDEEAGLLARALRLEREITRVVDTKIAQVREYLHSPEGRDVLGVRVQVVGEELEGDAWQVAMQLVGKEVVPFSSLVSRVVFTPHEQAALEWTSSTASSSSGIIFRCDGPPPSTLHVAMEFRHVPPRYHLALRSDTLRRTLHHVYALQAASPIKAQSSPRRDILNAFFRYVNDRNLIGGSARIELDPVLREEFEMETATMATLIQGVLSRLEDPAPFEFDIRMGVACTHDVPFAVYKETERSSALSKWVESVSQGVDELHEAFASVVQQAREAKARREIFKAFAEDPVKAIHALVESQQRDLDFLTHPTPVAERGERERAPAMWQSPVGREALRRYLDRQDTVDVAELLSRSRMKSQPADS